MNLFHIFLFGQLFLLSLCYKNDSENEKKSLKWPTTYHFRGEKILLLSGMIEPFEIWYNKELSMSRKDYYNGTVKYYYRNEVKDNNTVFEYVIYPKTSEKVRNKLICEKTEYEDEAKDFLPDSDEFEYQGTEDIKGKNCEKWQRVVNADEEKLILVLWVAKAGDNYILVRSQHQEYDSWKGELTENIVVNYFDFHKDFTEEIFEIQTDLDCIRTWTTDDVSASLQFYDPDKNDDLEKAFYRYKTEHKKRYRHEREHNYRKKIFRNNMRRINLKNRLNLSYKLGLNRFADYSKKELKYLTGIRPRTHLEEGTIKFPHSTEEIEDMVSRGDIPKNLDLRVEGLVTPVRDQLNCGSCWAFATTAAIEGAIAKSNGGRLLSLSEQAFIDCAWGFDNFGCEGGDLRGAFKWALKYALPTSEEYGPYLQKNGFCRLFSNLSELHNINGFSRVTHSENAMKVTLYKYGPVAAAIHASNDMFFYKSGIFYDHSCEDAYMNHGVAVVGYGELDGQTYWIIKNSWGHLWGEQGFMLISTKNNNCLVLNEAYYAIVY